MGTDKPKIPDPLIEVAIEQKTKGDFNKLLETLKHFAQEDQSFHFSENLRTKQIVIKGIDEPHLEAKVDLLRRVYDIDVNVGVPQVAYRETITRKAMVDYTYKKQSGG